MFKCAVERVILAPYSPRIHVEIFALGVVKQEYFLYAVEELAVSRIYLHEALVPLPNLIKSAFQKGLLLKGQLLEAVDY